MSRAPALGGTAAQDIVAPLHRLEALRLSCWLEAQTSARLPGYLGSTLRGALGHALKRTVCTRNMAPCQGCHLLPECVYPALFESPHAGGEQAIRRLRDIPHPYVIEPPPWRREPWRPGERLEFGLVLLGDCIARLPYWVFAVRALGEGGLGKEAHPFWLAEVRGLGGEGVYSGATGRLERHPRTARALPAVETAQSDGVCRIRFLTPTRVTVNNRLDRELAPVNLVAALARRAELMLHFHARVPLADLRLRALRDAAAGIRVVDSRLAFTDWQRYSNRQKQAIKMGGMTGRVVWRNVPPEIHALLRAGEYLHVGKGAVMGMGRYTIADAGQEEGDA